MSTAQMLLLRLAMGLIAAVIGQKDLRAASNPETAGFSYKLDEMLFPNIAPEQLANFRRAAAALVLLFGLALIASTLFSAVFR